MARKHLEAVRRAALRTEQSRQELRAAIFECVESGESYRYISDYVSLPRLSPTRVSDLYHEERRRRKQQEPPAE